MAQENQPNLATLKNNPNCRLPLIVETANTDATTEKLPNSPKTTNRRAKVRGRENRHGIRILQAGERDFGPQDY